MIWHVSEATRKEDEIVTVWHESSRPEGPFPTLTYAAVAKLLSSGDLSPLAGYVPSDQPLLRRVLGEFIAEVDEHYAASGPVPAV